MKELIHIPTVVSEGNSEAMLAPVHLGAGEFFAEPLLVEDAGAREVRIELAEGARLHLSAFVFATDAHTRLSVTVDLAGRDAQFFFHSLYIASGSGSAGIDVRVNHLVSDCNSRQVINGIIVRGNGLCGA